MSKEIGSHFEWDEQFIKTNGNLDWLPTLGGDAIFTFSGRNAITTAIQDMKKKKPIKTVYMPSYCCHSMMEPFTQQGIEIIFYDVTFHEEAGLMVHIDLSTECDIFFAMSYFGLGEPQLDETIEAFQKRGTLILEDITHRLLSEPSHSEKADYAIASLRKWFAIPTGGYVTKREGNFAEKPDRTSDVFTREKRTAMEEKLAYIQGENSDKQAFLDKFGSFERKLKTVGASYTIDETSLELLKKQEIKAIQEKRRKNASVLYEGITQHENIAVLLPGADFTTDTPLFVPLMLETTVERDSLRQFLIQHGVYPPVHWPQQEAKNDIFTRELSLICDQRYTEADMENVLSLIAAWQKANEEC